MNGPSTLVREPMELRGLNAMLDADVWGRVPLVSLIVDQGVPLVPGARPVRRDVRPLRHDGRPVIQNAALLAKYAPLVMADGALLMEGTTSPMAVVSTIIPGPDRLVTHLLAVMA